MKKLVYLFIPFMVTACGDSSTKETTTESISETAPVKVVVPQVDPELYQIVSEEPNETLKKNRVEVLLKDKVDKSTLENIALNLRQGREDYDNLWVFYNVPETAEGGMAWATTHFTPELEVQINGTTKEEDQELAKATADINGEILGKWKSDQSLSGGTLVLYKDPKGKLQMKVNFKGSSSMTEEIKESNKSGKVRYDFDNTHGEYYLLETNGNLGMYSKDGKFDEAVKM